MVTSLRCAATVDRAYDRRPESRKEYVTNPSVPRIVWESFLRVALPVLAVCGFALGYLKFAEVSGDLKIPIYVGVGIVSLGILGICTLGEAVYRAEKASRPTLPAILTVRAPQGNRGGEILCLLGPSPLFSVGMAVSFSWLDDHGFEVLVGLGQVINVQEDGKVQAALVNPVPVYQDTLNGMANNDKRVLEKIRVRPYVSYQALSDSQV